MSALLGERDRLIMNTVPRYATPMDRALMLTASATMFEVSLGGVPAPASITFSALMLGAVGDITFSSEPPVPLTVANGNAVLTYADMSASIVTVTASTVIEGVTYRARQTVAKQQALDLTPPPAPTGLAATGHPATITLTWNAAPANYKNLSHTEVWRAPTNNFAQAALVGRADGREYTDPVGPGAFRYYWIRYVSRAAIPGPYNASSGTVGASDAEVEHLLQVLTGEITESQLYADLGEKIDLIVPTRDAVADLEAVYGDTASAAASAAQAVQAAADAALKAAAADAAAGGASQYASQANLSATNASTSAGAASTSAGQSSQAATAAGGSAAAAESAASTAANAAGAAGASASAASTSKDTAASSATAAGVQAAASSQSAIEAKAARDAASGSASAALQSAGSASASSTAAGGAASQAATSADLAVGAKNTATGAAASASQSAGAAGAAETNAAGSASQAASSAQLAAASNTAAGGSAAAAAGSASTAGTKSTEAGQSATAANSARIAAEAASGQASGAAAAASGSASTADARATAAGQSATAANTSATTASTAAGQAGVFATQAATSKTAADGSAAAAASSLQQVQAIYRADLTNLCQDPTFAKGSSNWNQVGMIPQADGGSGAWPFATCALVTGRNNTQIAPQILVSPGETHYFSAWVSSQSGPDTPKINLGAYFTGTNGFQSIVLAATCTAAESHYDWLHIKGSLTVPAGARTANLYLGLDSDTTSMYWAVTGVEWRPSQIVQALGAIVNTEIQTRADQYAATSGRVDNIQASITGPDGLTAKYAAVKVTADATATALGQVKAKYGVQLDADGVAGGFELLAGGGRLDFGVRASTFFIAAPAGSGIAASVPFIVRTTETVIGGVTIPIGMYVADAFIQNASITNAKIGGDIWSSNFVAGQSGWRLYRSGDMEINNLHARGTVTGGGFTNVYDWPTNGQGGFHLSGSGLLIGNARIGGYFQVEPNGDFYTPGLSVVNRVAMFSGALVGASGTFSGNVVTGAAPGFRVEIGPDDPIYAMWAGSGAKTDVNAIFYMKRNGDSYFGGSLSAGTLRTSVTNPTFGPSQAVVSGPFGSNGGAITVVGSIALYSQEVSNRYTFSPGTGSTGCSFTLYRTLAGGAEAAVHTFYLPGTEDFRNFPSYDPEGIGSESYATRSINGSFTFTDPVQSTLARTYRLVAVVTLQNFTYTKKPGAPSGMDMTGSYSQRTTIVTTE